MEHQFSDETWELQVGDMCFFIGPADVYKKLRHRLIYRVINKEPTSAIGWSKHQYTLRPAFDLADRWSHPMAIPADVTKLGTNHMVKLDIVDLCRLRLNFDNFILERVRELTSDGDSDDASVVR